MIMILLLLTLVLELLAGWVAIWVAQDSRGGDLRLPANGSPLASSHPIRVGREETGPKRRERCGMNVPHGFRRH